MSLLSIPQAARLLGIAEITLRRKIWSRQIPFHKIGARYLFTDSDIERFLESCAVQPSLREQQEAAGEARRRLRASAAGAENE